MASQRDSFVCAVDRGSPNPESVGGDEESFADNRSAAFHTYFPLPLDPRNLEAHGIAEGIAQQGRLAFAHASSRTQRRAFIMHLYTTSHPDKNPGNRVAATEVSIYLSSLLALHK